MRKHVGRQWLLSIEERSDVTDDIKSGTKAENRRYCNGKELVAMTILAGKGDLGTGQNEDPSQV